MDILLEEKNVEKAKSYVTEVIKDLMRGKIPLEDLIISKSLSKKEYKQENAPHIQLAYKLEKRNPGYGPKSGDRVEYVIYRDKTQVYGKKSKTHIYERSEDPVYLKEHDMKIDCEYYLDNQISNPICTVLNAVVDDPEKFIGRIKGDEINRLTGTQKITLFCVPKNECDELNKEERPKRKLCDLEEKCVKTISPIKKKKASDKDIGNNASLMSWLCKK